MKTKLTAILSIIFLFSSLLNAQYTDFNLSKYKLPDIKTSSLDVELDLDHNMHNYIREGDVSIYDSRSRDFRGSFNANFYHFRNSAKYQGSQSLHVNYTPNYAKSVTDDDVSKNNNNNVNVYFNSINRFYNKSLNFIEVLPNFQYYLNNVHSSDPDSFDKSTQNSLAFSAPISIGHGRIEPVQDARLAIYILDELSKHGKIVNQPSESKILELAAEISKIKRKRFFDSRIRRIEELQAIDSFLVANNIVSSNDIIYFTQLNDQWGYAYGPARNAGFSMNFGFNNNIVLGKYKNETSIAGESIYKRNEFTIGGFGKLQYSKPLNLYWQSDLSFEMSYDYKMNRDPSDDNVLNDYNTNLLRPDLNYSIQYLPNSRTSIGLTLGLYYEYTFGERNIPDLFTGSTVSARISGNDINSYSALNMYYYFSPQLRLQVDWSLSVIRWNEIMKSDLLLYNTSDKYNYLNNNLSIRLIYSFF